MAFLYILKGRNTRFYIGSTNNLVRRLAEHCSGKSKYTSEVLPVILVFKQEFENLTSARKAEKWLKRQKDSDFIKRIIQEGGIKKVFGQSGPVATGQVTGSNPVPPT